TQISGHLPSGSTCGAREAAAMWRQIARSAVVWSGSVALVLLLAACQLIAPQPSAPSVMGQAQPPPARGTDRSPTAGAPASDTVLVLTTTARRGSLQATVVLAGVVVPGRTAQLA